MNPYRLKDVFNYLTSNNQLLKRKLKLGTSEIPIPPKRDDVTAIEAINRFNKDNPRVDTTDIQPVVKQSTMKQSNVGEVDEGVIQGAFDTATMEARDGGYPPPIYETFKKRYLKRNMKADGGRAGYEDGGMLVQPSADGSRPGYKKNKNKGSGFASEETQKKIQKITEEKITKRVNQIKKINDWTNNWFENNAGKYDSYEKTKKQLIKDWSKESKNKKYAGNFKLSLENGLPNIAAGTAEGSKATRVSNRIFDLNFPIQRSNKELIFQKGYANYRLQNPNFNKKINDYFDLIILDKRSYDVQQNLIQSG